MGEPRVFWRLFISICVQDVVECEPELRYNTWVTDVVHYASRSNRNQQMGDDKSVVLIVDGWYFWTHRRNYATQPVDFIKVILLLQV